MIKKANAIMAPTDMDLHLHELNCFHYCLLRAGCGNTSDWGFSLESFFGVIKLKVN